MYRELLAAGLFFMLIIGMIRLMLGHVISGLRHSDLGEGQQDAWMLLENLARTNDFLGAFAQTLDTP